MKINPRETKSPPKMENKMSDPRTESDKSMCSGQTLRNKEPVKVDKFDRTVKVEKGERTVASIPVSGSDLEDLAETVKSFMEKTENRTRNGLGFLYICTVCGKEGQSIDIQNHIEANHLDGFSISCNMCDKTARSRHELINHNHKP